MSADARTWLLAARPATLPAAVGPVLVGVGASLGAGVALRWDTAVACLAVSLLLQVAANFANDLSDFRRGADTAERLGPTRAAAAGLLRPRQLETAIAAVLVAAALVGLYLVSVGGVVLLFVGVAAMVAALAYTGGPMPYGYRGLGEVFVFLFFGLVAVVGTAYLQALRVEWRFVLAAIPVGALVTAILVVNNLRDIPTDTVAHKRTLAVMFGEAFAKAEYAALLLAAALMPPLMLLLGQAGVAALLPLVALPLAWPLWREVRGVGEGSDRRRLNLGPQGHRSAVAGLLRAVRAGSGSGWHAVSPTS